MFINCTKIKGNIPEDLFYQSYDLKILTDSFSGCTGLTGEIPRRLLESNTELTSVKNMFYGCTGLTGEIPSGLLDNNTKISNINGIFYGCTGINGKIPEGLFKNCPLITGFDGVFNNTSIDEIPADLFDINNGQPNNIKDIAFTFAGTNIKTVPEGLFDLCTEVTTFGRSYGQGTFEGCTLLETIPDKLFYKNQKVTSFAYVFRNCTNLKEIPENTFNTSEEVSMRGTFTNCKSITKIEGSVFKNIPNITDLMGTFNGCSNLEEITETEEKEEGFMIGEKVTNISYIFFDCKKLSKIPDGICIQQNVTDMTQAFNNCSNLNTTITLKSIQAKYNTHTFGGVSGSNFKLNWAEPCTEEIIDAMLTEVGRTDIKGEKVTEL